MRKQPIKTHIRNASKATKPKNITLIKEPATMPKSQLNNTSKISSRSLIMPLPLLNRPYRRIFPKRFMNCQFRFSKKGSYDQKLENT